MVGFARSLFGYGPARSYENQVPQLRSSKEEEKLERSERSEREVEY